MAVINTCSWTPNPVLDSLFDMHINAAIFHPFVREFEGVWLAKATPAVSKRPPVQFVDGIKAFNMSEGYAEGFGSGAREHVQNWWDECRVRAENTLPIVRRMDYTLSSAIAQRYHLRPDTKAYAAFSPAHIAGNVARLYRPVRTAAASFQELWGTDDP